MIEEKDFVGVEGFENFEDVAFTTEPDDTNEVNRAKVHVPEGPQVPAGHVEENSQPRNLSLIIGIIIFGLLLLFTFAQEHLAEINSAASNITMGVLIVGCLYLVIRYFRQIKNAAIIARRGNALLAKKTALQAFIPAIGSANLAIYNFLNSEMVQKYTATAKGAGNQVKEWLIALSPDKGQYIYYGGIAVLVILLNGVVVKSFRKAMRVARIFGA